MVNPWTSAEGLPLDVNTEKEFNKFQIRANEPSARAAEQQVFDDYRSEGLYPWNLNSRPEVDWSEGKQDILGWQVRPGNVERISPATNAGITNSNLNGYKMMNALSMDPTADDFFLRELFNYGKRYFPGYDPENDEWRQKKYRDSLPEENEFPPYDPNNPDHFMMPPGGLPEDFPLGDIFNAPTMEASVDPDDWRTIIKILEAGGNPDDYITKVDYDEEEPVMGNDIEEGGGWLSNPLMQQLRRRNMERNGEQMMRLQMDMLMNRNKFNTSPGTGEENPILGDPYWNI